MDSTKIKQKLSETKIVKKANYYYDKHKRFVPVISFFAGFTWDSVTLTRIDLLTDNLILLSYILLLGLCIVLINLINDKIIQKPFILKYEEWYPLAMQFFLGGLFSSYVVFYFQSASLTKNWLFLSLLIFVLLANEFIKNRLSNLYLQFILYFLASFSFFIFFIPVLIRIMNTFIFLLSGFISLGFILLILYFIYSKSKEISARQFKKLSAVIVSILLMLNLFYFLNWIPPVPLSLKDGAVYHHVSRHGDLYKLKFEKGSWYQFWKKSDGNFHYCQGDTVFCYAAVFAPTKLNKRIYHHWQYYDFNKNDWITTDRLSYKIIGGRDGGYRGYTNKRNIQPGQWRIDVKTSEDQLLGRINFEITLTDKKPVGFKTIYK